MTQASAADLLALHAVRIVGFADTPTIARRFGLDPAATEELLRDAEAYGWVQHAAFADLSGWSLTERGRAQDERLLAAELARVDGQAEVRDVYRGFLPLNTRLQRACTDWQLRPTSDDRLATNDHTDDEWDAASWTSSPRSSAASPRSPTGSGSSSRGSRGTTGGSPSRDAAPRTETVAGSTGPTSTPVTASGSSSTKTSSPPSGSTGTHLRDGRGAHRWAERGPPAQRVRYRA